MTPYCCLIMLTVIITVILYVVMTKKEEEEIPISDKEMVIPKPQFCKILPKGYEVSENHSVVTYIYNASYTMKNLRKETMWYYENGNFPMLPELTISPDHCDLMFIYDVHLADEPIFYTSLEDLPDYMPPPLKDFIASEHQEHGTDALERVWIEYNAPKYKFDYFLKEEILEAREKGCPLIKVFETPHINIHKGKQWVADYAQIKIYLWTKNYDGVRYKEFSTNIVDFLPVGGRVIDHWDT